ncbi:MAG: DNA-binding protein [Acidobacteriota bacterium]
MAQLIVRNLDEQIVRELKVRAAGHGRSAEAEHREILHEALLPSQRQDSIKDALLAMPGVGEDSDFERDSDPGREIDL